MMTQTRYDVLAIGNAIVDVISDADDAFIEAQKLNKGGMTLIDADRAQSLYDAIVQFSSIAERPVTQAVPDTPR